MIEHPKAAQWQYDERLKLNQKLMLSALSKSLCIVRDAIEMVNEYAVTKLEKPEDFLYLDRNCHYRWVRDDEIYKMYFDDLNSDIKDFGESQLLKCMRGFSTTKTITRYDKEGKIVAKETETSEPVPIPSTVIFFNKTRNKDRGYIERQEITTPEGIKINGMAPIVLQVANNGTNEGN